jgi:alpha-D-ribose 1-methylphosphonate 5-triphosphate diphosphatase
VNIARALITRPDLLLLDEPTSALDAENQAAVVELLAEQLAAGATMLGAFHDAPSLARLASRIAQLEQGRLVRIASPTTWPRRNWRPSDDATHSYQRRHPHSPRSGPGKPRRRGWPHHRHRGPRHPGGLDLRGALVTPGFIDLHNDGLEVEINPRPGVGLPLQFALHNFDQRAAGAGLVLAFHAITFANFEKKDRSVETADERARAIRVLRDGDSIVEHQVLFRAGVWQPEGLPLLLERVQDWDTRIVTINDHTPGQGQYRDVGTYKRFVRDWAGRTEDEVEHSTAEKMAFAREHPEVGNRTFETLRTRRGPLGLVLGSHDDDTAERCAFLHSVGATVAEFPVTLEAAEQARALGMTIVAGAPNIVRGGSHSGNVSALELVARGLCDILVADYHAPSLLLAVQHLVERRLLPGGRRPPGQHQPGHRRWTPGNEHSGPGRAATCTVVRARAGEAWRAAAVIRHGRLRAQFEQLETARALAVS